MFYTKFTSVVPGVEGHALILFFEKFRDMGDFFTEKCERYPLFLIKLGEKSVPVSLCQHKSHTNRYGDRPTTDLLYVNFMSSS